MHVIGLLSMMQHGAADCPRILEQMACSLTSLQRDHEWDASESPALLLMVRRAEHKTRLVQELLDSAASYYSGWLSAGETAASYLPAIEGQRGARRGAFSIEA
jgi:hypothetical protein